MWKLNNFFGDIFAFSLLFYITKWVSLPITRWHFQWIYQNSCMKVLVDWISWWVYTSLLMSGYSMQPDKVAHFPLSTFQLNSGLSSSWIKSSEHTRKLLITIPGTGVENPPSSTGMTKVKTEWSGRDESHTCPSYFCSNSNLCIIEATYKLDAVCSHILKYEFVSAIKRHVNKTFTILNEN